MVLELRKCTRCGGVKPATTEFFHSRSDRDDGLETQCKECKRKGLRESRQRNNYRASRAETAAFRRLREAHWDEWQRLLDEEWNRLTEE